MSFVVAVVAAAVAHLVAEDPETDVAVAVVTWLGTFGWLLWQRL